MKAGKLDFLAMHSTDPVIASAILTAPHFLSRLTDEETTFVKRKVEEHLAPEIVEARNAKTEGHGRGRGRILPQRSQPQSDAAPGSLFSAVCEIRPGYPQSIHTRFCGGTTATQKR